MKKLTCFFLTCFLCMNVFAGKFTSVVFLGDSLSDNGNLYKLLINLVPKSPPYYQGRFSNGPTWAEYVGNYYLLKSNSKYKIYALGGATAILHPPAINFIAPTTLELELTNYLTDSLFKNKKAVLFAIWIGANDYFFDKSLDIDAMTSKVVDKISWSIETLIRHGAKNFLILNLPELSKTPFAATNNIVERLRILTQIHNQKIDEMVFELKQKYPDLTFDFINIHETMTDFVEHPDKYNQKYHVNVKDTTNACWQGGYFFRKSVLEQFIEDDVNEVQVAHKNYGTYDVQTIKDFISESPEINYTYSMSKMYGKGPVPCFDPDQHLFWDEMHPTAVIHRVLSEVVIESLNQNFS